MHAESREELVDRRTGDGREPTRPGAFALQAVGVALAWIALYRLNEVLFSAIVVDRFITWIFLPAAIRVLAVLVFGCAGVAGLFIGALLTSPPWDSLLMQNLTVSLVSATAPLLAVQFCRRRLGLAADLKGLTLGELLQVGLVGSGLSAVLHNLAFFLFQMRTDAYVGLLPMFVGDLVGTLIVLFAAAVLIRLADERSRGQRG